MTCVFTCFDPSDEGFLAATTCSSQPRNRHSRCSSSCKLRRVSTRPLPTTRCTTFERPRSVVYLCAPRYRTRWRVSHRRHDRKKWAPALWPEAKRLAEPLFSKLPSVLGAAPRDFVLGLVSLINSLTSGKIQCHARSVRGSLLRTRCSVFDK